ncbi:MAG: DUF4231 domain-containing protein [Chthoniobacterales bacterium]|nr:DUF4231 domain-containing protein [Chthoniobacterales bacterium]
MSEEFDYLQRRLEPQEKWAEAKARINKRLFYTAELSTLLAGAAIPVVNLWVVKDAYLAGVLSAVLGGAVVLSAAVGKLFKFHDNWLHYRGLVEAMAREKELYAARSGDYAAPRDEGSRNRLLVERVENLFASATTRFLEAHRTAQTSFAAET